MKSEKCLRTAWLQLESVTRVTERGRGGTGRSERFCDKNSIKWKCPFISWRWKTGNWMKGWFFWVWQNTGRQKIVWQRGRDKPKARGEIMEQEGNCFLWILQEGWNKKCVWELWGSLWWFLRRRLQSAPWSHGLFVENVTRNQEM